MTNKPLLILIFLLFGIGSFAQTTGTLQIDLTTVTYGGRYAWAGHCAAVWIEDASGNIVQTKALFAQRFMWTLTCWQQQQNNKYLAVDASTGASRTSHGAINVTWDATDLNGNVVADGKYFVGLEMTEQNDQGQCYSHEFTKGPAPQELYPANATGFSNVSIVWTPDVVANEPPTVSITSPSNGATVSESSVEVMADAQDSDGSVSLVKFYVDGNLVETDNSSPYSTTLSALSSGSVEIQAIAVDDAGAESDPSTISITIPSNEAPTVSITSPSNGTSIENDALEVTASAQDSDGSIAQVDFYVDGVLFDSDNSSPYSIELNALSSGDVEIKAVAVDDKGAESSPSTITVSVPCLNSYVLSGSVIGIEGSYIGDGIESAVDGNESTYFDAPTDPGSWVGLDFGSPQYISAVRVLPRSSNAARLEGIQIQVSNDEKFNNSIVVATTSNIVNTEWKCYYVSLPDQYQYMRLYDADGGRFNIAELECYTPTQTMPEYDGTGLSALYFEDAELQQAVLDKLDENIDFDWATSSPENGVPANAFSVQWIGKIKSPSTGACTFSISTSNGIRLWIDNELIIDEWGNSSSNEFSASANLQEANKHDIKVEFAKASGSGNISLSWEPEGFAKSIVEKSYLYPELTQSFILNDGWNLLSFYVLPDDNSISSLFNGIPLKYVKDDDGFFNASYEDYLNSLTAIVSGKGYFVYVDNNGSDVELNINGNLAPSNYFSVDKYNVGWNLIGLGSYPVFIESIQDDIQVIKNSDTYWNGDQLGELDILQPGEGYFLKK